MFTAHKPFFYRMFCSGGIDPEDPHNPKDNKEHLLMVWFRDYLGSLLNLRPVKIIVLSLFICYLGFASYGVTKVQEGLERRKLTRYDSYAIDFFDTEDLYFRDYPYRIQVSYFPKSIIVFKAKIDGKSIRLLSINTFMSKTCKYC